MKNKSVIEIVVGLSICGLLIAGCATTSNQNNTAAEQAAITAAAAVGTAYAVEQNPTLVPDFRTADQALASLAGSTNTLTVSTVEAVLAANGQTNSITPVVSVAIVSAFDLADAYIQNNIATPSSQQVAMRSVLLWISEGVAQGLPAAAKLKATAKLK